MAWNGFTLTVEGQNALTNAQLSGRMNIKSIMVGDGAPPANFRVLKGLVNPLYEITELKIDVTESGCTLTAEIPEVGYDYYFREIGIMVSTEEGDKLYAYDNSGEDAQHMVNTTGVETTKKRVRLSLAISDVAEIKVINPSVLYVAYDDFDRVTGELGQAVEILNAAMDQKANAKELDGHVGDGARHLADGERDMWNAKMGTSGNSANNVVTFLGGDSMSPASWTDMEMIQSGESHGSLFRKLSLAVKNVRYLYKLLTSGALSTVLGQDLPVNRAMASDAKGKLSASGVTTTELGCLSGVKAGIQGQIDELNTGLTSTNRIIAYFSSASIKWLGVSMGVLRYSKSVVVQTFSGALTADLTAYQKYVVGQMAAEYRPNYQVTKIICIHEDVTALLNITMAGTIELTPYAVLRKGYTPLVFESYMIK